MALGGWRQVARLQGCPDPPPRPSCTGSLVGQRLSDHPDVRKIGFTGSTEVGKHIMRRWVVERAEGPGLTGQWGSTTSFWGQPEGREGLGVWGCRESKACAGTVGEGRRCGPGLTGTLQPKSSAALPSDPALELPSAPMFCVPHPPSRVPCPVSRVPCPVSCVPHPVSCVLCPMSCVPCPMSRVLCPPPRVPAHLSLSLSAAP